MLMKGVRLRPAAKWFRLMMPSPILILKSPRSSVDGSCRRHRAGQTGRQTHSFGFERARRLSRRHELCCGIQGRLPRLAAMPDIGPPRPALGSNARVVIILPYLVIYEHRDNVVTVFRVLHGKRNITREFLR